MSATEEARKPLAGRTAFVTGAARGIGTAIARRLHRDGARVALTDIDHRGVTEVASGLDASGESAFALKLDVRDRDAFAAAAQTATRRLDAVEILVNNAGGMVRRSLWEIDAREWDDVLAVNLRSALFGCQLLGPAMRERGWGRIINLGSLAGQQGGLIAGAHYAAAKAGVTTLTKVAAADLASSGVTVNAIAPAAISGPAMDALGPELRASIPTRIPVGRAGKADEVAALAAFLCTDAAAFITGATLDINGGVLMR